MGQADRRDIAQIDGSTEKLVGLLQERYGYARERAAKEVADFEKRQTTTNV